MIEQYLLSLEGLARFQSASFVIFFLMFCGIAVRVAMLKQSTMDDLARMPLDDQHRSHDPLHEVKP